MSPRLEDGRFRQRLRSLLDKVNEVQRAIEAMLIAEEAPKAVRRIVVVEDDPSARNALGAIFSRRGWDVAAVGTLVEGLAALVPPPDCMILDLMLPDGDGSAILEAARMSGLATRIVVTTGVADPARLAAVAGLGPDSLLQKPVELDELYRACLGPG